MHIFCDFDGTITIEDGTDYVLSRLASPEWLDIENMWRQGLIGSAECMCRQVGMINASKEQLHEVLDQIEIDHTFTEFANYCRLNHIPITIISDGVDYFIKRILSRHRLDGFPIIANRLTITENLEYLLSSPHSFASCKSRSGVCKCSIVGLQTQPRFYIGDGRSDFCVANKPEKVFAKGKLAEYCFKNDIPYTSFTDFDDITNLLRDQSPMIRNFRLPIETYPQ